MTKADPTLDYPLLIGDIGGTNARFAVLETPEADLSARCSVRVAEFASVEEAVAHVLSALGCATPACALIAAAGPIRSDGLDLTNSDWVIRPELFLPRTGIGSLLLVNDFEAQALALPFLEGDALAMIGAGDARPSDATKAVIGPGTGLGVGALVRAGDFWVPVPGEGGHVDCGPRNEREAAIWPHLDAVDGRISCEQILSGNGIENLHRAIGRADGRTASMSSAADITSAALDGGGGQAHETMSIFCSVLGRVAGDLALTTMARGGVYIAGGIVRHILPFLTESGFRDAFDDKAPHGAVMRSIATVAVDDPLPALRGLAGFAAAQDRFILDRRNRFWQR